MDNIKIRILKFIETLPYGQDKFEKKCGLSRGYVNKLADNMTAKTQAKIQNEFPELNMEWLIKGEGLMLDKNKIVQSADYNDFVLAVLVDEIASLKATTKGSLFVDERDAIMSKIERVSAR